MHGVLGYSITDDRVNDAVSVIKILRASLCKGPLSKDDLRVLISHAAGMTRTVLTEPFHVEICHTRFDLERRIEVANQALLEVVISCRGYFLKEICLTVFVYLFSFSLPPPSFLNIQNK